MPFSQLYFNAYVKFYKALGGGWLLKRTDAVDATGNGPLSTKLFITTEDTENTER
ncbi:hypothetical protein [uncultured Desulfobacter sp.]|uniref:hypothetical protein n=1 Tax=uncultured Desulfobacter sp. TaxID=240139 RepID=UPI0029C98804|nr:hypothetical protein [uncultured Desulfobacter sp.]